MIFATKTVHHSARQVTPPQGVARVELPRPCSIWAIIVIALTAHVGIDRILIALDVTYAILFQWSMSVLMSVIWRRCLCRGACPIRQHYIICICILTFLGSWLITQTSYIIFRKSVAGSLFISWLWNEYPATRQSYSRIYKGDDNSPSRVVILAAVYWPCKYIK